MTAFTDGFLVEFSLILVFAIFASVVSVRMKLPPIIGFLLAGMFLGPNVLGLTKPDSLNILADIGSVLLLFMIGVQFSVSKLLSTGIRAVMASFMLMLIAFLIVYEAAIIFNLDTITAIFVAAAFSFSSTTIIVKTLEQQGLMARKEVPLLVTILIIEDLAAIFMLTFFSSLKTGGKLLTVEGIASSFIISLSMLALAYFILEKIFRHISNIFLRYQTHENMVFFSFALGIAMSILASWLNLSPGIGAFLAGSIIASLPNGRLFEESIKPFSLVFSSFFFISVGISINPFALLAMPYLTAGLILISFIAISIATFFSVYLFTSNGRAALFSAMAMLPIGEFSLLIARESHGFAPVNLVGIVSLTVLLTSLTSSLFARRSDELYEPLKKMFPQSFRRYLTLFSNYLNKTLGAFEPGGHINKTFTKELEGITRDIVMLVAFLLAYLLVRLIDTTLIIYNSPVNISTVILAIFLITGLASAIRIIYAVKKIINSAVTVFSRTAEVATTTRVLFNLSISVVLIIMTFNFPFLIDILKLPRVFNALSLFSFVMSFMFLWSVLRILALRLVKITGKPINLFREKIIISQEEFIDISKTRKK